MSAAHLALFVIKYWIHIQFFLLSLAEPPYPLCRALPGKHNTPSTLGPHLWVSNAAHQVPRLYTLKWLNNTSQEPSRACEHTSGAVCTAARSRVLIRKWHRWAEPCRWGVTAQRSLHSNAATAAASSGNTANCRDERRGWRFVSEGCDGFLIDIGCF